MTSSSKTRLRSCTIASTLLLLAGCNQPADELATAPQVPARTEIGLSRTDAAKSDGAATGEAPPAALDLSLPAQPAVEFGSLENAASPKQPLLPDLFTDTRKPAQNNVRLRGSVFMSDTEREDREAVDGGQVTIEQKTR